VRFLSWVDKKLDYILSLTRDGRVVSSNFVMKSENENTPGASFVVPKGIFIINTDTGAEYQPGQSVKANKSSFDSFKNFVASGTDASKDWSIVDMASAASQRVTIGARGQGQEGKPAQSLFGDINSKNFSVALGVFRLRAIDSVEKIIEQYAAKQIDIASPKFLQALNDFLLNDYQEQLEVGFAKKDEDGQTALDDSGNPIFDIDENGMMTHISGVKVDAKYLDIIPANIEYATQLLLSSLGKGELAREIFKGDTSRRVIFESVTGIKTRQSKVEKKDTNGQQLRKKTPKEGLKTGLEYSLNVLLNANNFVEVLVKNEESKNVLLQSFRDLQIRLVDMSKNINSLPEDVSDDDRDVSLIRQEYSDIIATLEKTVKGLEKESTYPLKIKKLRFSVDQVKLNAVIDEVSSLLSSLPSDSHERKKAEVLYETLQLINISKNIDDFISTVVESSEGITRELLVDFLLGFKNGKVFQQNDDGSMYVSSEFSLFSSRDLLEELSIVVGLKRPSFSDTFTVGSVLRHADLAKVLFPSLEISSERQVHLLEINPDIAPKVREYLDKFMEMYDMKNILSIADNETRAVKIKELLKNLGKVKGKDKPTADYFINRINSNLGRDGRFLRSGEVRRMDATNVEQEFLLENFTASLMLTSSAYNLREASHRFKLVALKSLRHFKDYPNPHGLVMLYSSMLGVHEQNDSLVMNSDLKNKLEELVYKSSEDSEAYANLTGDSEKVAFLVNFFSRNSDKVQVPLAMLAVARMESFREAQGFVNYEDSSLKISLSKIDNFNKFSSELKAALSGKDRDRNIRQACANTLYSTYKGEQSRESDVALDYLYRSSASFSGADANDGYYTEALVNINIARELGEMTDYIPSSDPTIPSILKISGRDGKRYEIMTHATDRAGYGDSHVVEYDNEGRATVYTIEQKANKTNMLIKTPHLGDVSGTSEVFRYLETITNQPVKKANSFAIYVNSDSGEVEIDDKLVAKLDTSTTEQTVQGKSATSISRRSN